MSPAHFQHIRLSLAHDVVLVEILSPDVQGPERALEFSTELNSVAGYDCARPLLVDLCRARYLSSMGYSALFKLVKQAKERQRPVRFCNLHPDVRVGAEIVGLTRVVEIHDSVQSALQAFAQPCAATAGVATPAAAGRSPGPSEHRRAAVPPRIEEGEGARGAAALKAYSWEAMIAALAAARDRASRASAALQQAGIAHVVAGGQAVAAWIAQVDQEAVPNTRDGDLLVRRQDWPRVLEVLQAAGFVPQVIAGAHRLRDGPGGSVRNALRIVFAGEKVRPDDLLPAPEVSAAEAGPDFPVPTLDALVRMQLSSFRLKDKVHLLAMLEAGLLDESWRGRLPPELAARLEELAAEGDPAS
jgi:anti-anti-sigma factor